VLEAVPELPLMPRWEPRPPLTDAQRDLAGANWPLVHWFVGRFCRRRPDLVEEVRDAATDGLLDAARNFDPAVECSFATLAHRSMFFSALSRLRFLAREIRNCPAQLLSLDQSDPELLAELGLPPRLPDDEPDFDALIAPLPERHRALLRARFVDDATLDEAGAAIGVTRQRAHQLEARGLAALRSLMANDARPARRSARP
jgi:RNA polymerase sigma factor (sigma-70 family)